MSLYDQAVPFQWPAKGIAGSPFSSCPVTQASFALDAATAASRAVGGVATVDQAVPFQWFIPPSPTAQASVGEVVVMEAGSTGGM